MAQRADHGGADGVVAVSADDLVRRATAQHRFRPIDVPLRVNVDEHISNATDAARVRALMEAIVVIFEGVEEWRIVDRAGEPCIVVAARLVADSFVCWWRINAVQQAVGWGQAMRVWIDAVSAGRGKQRMQLSVALRRSSSTRPPLYSLDQMTVVRASGAAVPAATGLPEDQPPADFGDKALLAAFSEDERPLVLWAIGRMLASRNGASGRDTPFCEWFRHNADATITLQATYGAAPGTDEASVDATELWRVASSAPLLVHNVWVDLDEQTSHLRLGMAVFKDVGRTTLADHHYLVFKHSAQDEGVVGKRRHLYCCLTCTPSYDALICTRVISKIPIVLRHGWTFCRTRP